jgi:hypothetical protein
MAIVFPMTRNNSVGTNLIVAGRDKLTLNIKINVYVVISITSAHDGKIKVK